MKHRHLSAASSIAVADALAICRAICLTETLAYLDRLCSLSAGHAGWTADFRISDKKRILAETMAAGATVSSVANKYEIDTPLLFRWKREVARLNLSDLLLIQLSCIMIG